MSLRFSKGKKIHEDFLQFVWKHRRILFENLHTTSDHSINIIDPGEHNSNAGPDFLNARIKINDTLWAGNVEIHVHSSEWFKHGHGTDPAYDNVILHVVYKEDLVVFNKNNFRIPCLELSKLITENSINRYLQLKYGKTNWIPCEPMLPSVPEHIIESTLSRLMVERLERKTNSIFLALKRTKNDLEQVLFENIAKYFGTNINSLPFELLAIHTPWNLLSKYRGNLLMIEALLFGQAGFLNEVFIDAYPNSLQRLYRFLQNKHALKPIPSSWRFMRLRPPNFPTLRIAQFAAIVNQQGHLLSDLSSCPNKQYVYKMFSISPSEYWSEHFVFDKKSSGKSRIIGESSIDVILINGVIPFLFCYGRLKGDHELISRSIEWLETIRPEKNKTTKKWRQINICAESAAHSQALLELKGQYCEKKKCLNCNIGAHLVR